MPLRLDSNWLERLGVALAVAVLSGGAAAPAARNANATAARSPSSGYPFREVAIEAGLLEVHHQRSDQLASQQEALGSGACALDFDGDGLLDLFLVGGTGHTRHYGRDAWWHSSRGQALYRNVTARADAPRFEDATEASGISGRNWGMGCAAGDLDADGDVDLFVTTVGANLVYRNDGDGTFTNVTSSSGIEGSSWSTSAALSDFNGDGLLDIYVPNYIHFRQGARTFEAQRGFRANADASFIPQLYDAQPNQLYVNRGELRFEDVAAEYGVEDATGRSLSAAWLDVDTDGRDDLIVVNGADSPTRLFLNRKDHFAPAPEHFRLEAGAEHRGIAIGDIDNDLDEDVVITTPAAYSTLVLMREGSAEGAEKGGGAVHYTDRVWDLDLSDDRSLAFSSWGASLADFDNDGWLDLFLNNGFAAYDPDTPHVPQGQPKSLWFNRLAAREARAGARAFEAIEPQRPDIFYSPASGRASLSADFDNDGDLDLLLTHNNDPVELLVNRPGARSDRHWLGIQLRDRAGAAAVFGARVTLHTDTRRYLKSSARVYSFLAQNDPRFHFGLGAEDRVRSVSVRWPDGGESVIEDPVLDRYIEIDQSSGAFSVLEPAYQPPAVASERSPFRSENYLRWQTALRPLFGRMNFDRQQIAEVRALLDGLPLGAEASLYEALLQNRDVDIVAISKRAIEPQAELEVRLAGIDWLRVAELEPTAHWLIALLDDPSARVRCAVAASFEHFYREEEAMVVRKNLAVPALMRMLEGAEPAVSVCGLRALAESENYRAVEPAVALLAAREAPVRLEALRTLGKLRQGRARAPLRAVALDEAAAAPERAAAVIALVRVADPQIEEIYDRVIRYDPAASAAATDGASELEPAVENASGLTLASRVVSALLLDAEEGVVVQRNEISDRFLRALEQSKLQKRYRDLSPSERALVFRAIAATRDLRILHFLEAPLSDRDAQIRLSALTALAQARSEFAVAQLQRALADASRDVQRFGVEFFAASGIGVRDDALAALAARGSFPIEAYALFQPRNAAIARPVIQRAVRVEVSAEVRRAGLAACAALSGSKLTVPQELLDADDAEELEAALRCAASQDFYGLDEARVQATYERLLEHPDATHRRIAMATLGNPNRAWSLRVVRNILAGQYRDAELKQLFLAEQAEHAGFAESISVQSALRSNDEAWKRMALELLADPAREVSLSERTESTLLAMAANPREVSSVRMGAIEVLARRSSTDPGKLLEIVGELPTD